MTYLVVNSQLRLKLENIWEVFKLVFEILFICAPQFFISPAADVTVILTTALSGAVFGAWYLRVGNVATIKKTSLHVRFLFPVFVLTDTYFHKIFNQRTILRNYF